MKQVFGLPEPLGQMSPVHIPRGFTQAYIEGEVVEDLPARIRAAHARVRAIATSCSSRGPAMPGSGRSSGCRTPSSPAMLGAPAVIVSRGRRRPADRRDRAQRVAVRAPRRARSPARSSTRSTSTPSPGSPGRSSAASPATASRCSASCRTGRSCRTRPSAMVLEGVHGETHPCRARTSTRSSAAIAIGAMEPEHMLERIGPRSLVIVPGDRRTSSRRSSARATDGADGGRRRARPRPDRRLPAGEPRSSTRSAPPTCSRRSSPEDTYQVASELHDLLVKTHPADAGKIAEIKALLWEYLFIDRVLEAAPEARASRVDAEIIVPTRAAWPRWLGANASGIRERERRPSGLVGGRGPSGSARHPGAAGRPVAVCQARMDRDRRWRPNPSGSETLAARRRPAMASAGRPRPAARAGRASAFERLVVDEAGRAEANGQRQPAPGRRRRSSSASVVPSATET